MSTVPPLPANLAALVEAILAKAGDRTHIALEEVADAIGVRAISSDEIEAILHALEGAGRVVDMDDASPLREHLKTVLKAARLWVTEQGRKPSPSDIAEKAGLPLETVRRALALARVLQR